MILKFRVKQHTDISPPVHVITLKIARSTIDSAVLFDGNPPPHPIARCELLMVANALLTLKLTARIPSKLIEDAGGRYFTPSVADYDYIIEPLEVD